MVKARHGAPDTWLLSGDPAGTRNGSHGREAAGEGASVQRLYVSPGARGLGLGMALIDAIIGVAVRIGVSRDAIEP